MELFYSIQGEGFHQGKAAAFIRLGGCDVGCVWCDVKDSWDVSRHPEVLIGDIVNKVQQFQAEICVITGGEPTLYDLVHLTAALHSAGKRNHLETAAVYPISGSWDWICISPKKFRKPLEENLKKADELKVIVFNTSDFEWAEEHAAKVSPACELFLQPEWSREKEMLPLIVGYIKDHPRWNISLQLHKYLHVP